MAKQILHDLPQHAVLNFASTVKNVCDGVGAVLALNYQHEGERLEENDLDPQTTISMLQMESLMALSRASVAMLQGEADRLERWAETHHSGVE